MDSLTSFDQINLSATLLQFAVIVAFAVAIQGVWRTSRRPLMRALAGYWALIVAGAFVNIGSSWSGAIWRDRMLSLSLTTVVVALQAAAIPYVIAALHALDAPERHPPVGRRAVACGVAALLVHGAGVAWFFVFMPANRLGMVMWSRSVDFAILLVPAVLAWRALMNREQHRGAVRLLAVGWTALALRAALEVGFGLQVGRPPLPAAAVIAAVVVNVVAMITLGVATLIAGSMEEFDALERQSRLLQHTQLRLAQMERIESLGRLAGGVAHDFNNVLHIIGLAADDGVHQPDSEAKNEAFREVMRASERGSDFARQLLGFARVQSSARERFDACVRLESLTVMLRRLAGTVGFSLETSPMPAMLEMDPSQLDQIVLNLFVNALDASAADGRVTAAISFRDVRDGAEPQRLPPGRYVSICVADDGSGIPPHALAHIFEPFYTTKDGRGTGLGLATVKSIVNGAGGTITVQSEPGRGTTFETLLPYSMAATPAAAS